MLPVIDLNPFLADPSGAAADGVVEALRDACHRIGFCYLSGHGVDVALERRLMAESQAFFRLPESDRQAIAIGRSPHFRGYTVLGDERTGGRRDWRDQIDIGPEEPATEVRPGDPPWLPLRGPNQWPAGQPGLCPAVLAWMTAMNELGTEVMRALALGLGQPAGCFDAALQPDPYTRVKIMRYPALPPSAPAERGLGMHQDSGLLSFILQDEVGGLEVETGDAVIPVEPISGTYVMNLGEMLQRASGGYLNATRHQVRSPPAGRERVSVACFFNPRLDTVFEPLSLPPELAPAARGMDNPDPGDPIHATFGENALKIRMRAHPDVTAAFYGDVQIPGGQTGGELR